MSLLTSDDRYVVVCGDFQASPDGHVNRAVIFDLDLKRHTRKDQTVRGRGSFDLFIAGWIEQANIVTFRDKHYLALSALQHMNLYLWEIEDQGITFPIKIVENVTARHVHNRKNLSPVFINDMIFDKKEEAFITASSDYTVSKLSLLYKLT